MEADSAPQVAPVYEYIRFRSPHFADEKLAVVGSQGVLEIAPSNNSKITEVWTQDQCFFVEFEKKRFYAIPFSDVIEARFHLGVTASIVAARKTKRRAKK